MKTNNYGEYTDCFAHIADRSGNNLCNALEDWYNGKTTTHRCKGCPFFKTREQVDKERERCKLRLSQKQKQPVTVCKGGIE